MKMNILLSIALAGALGLGVLQARTWTSADGKKTFEGTLKSWDESAGTVTVVMATGRTVTFDLAKLSEADQSFLKEQPVGEAGVQDGDVAAAEFEKTVIGKALRKMEILEGKSFKKHEFTKPPEFYILYYSASW
jgi:hypothetical protein